MQIWSTLNWAKKSPNWGVWGFTKQQILSDLPHLNLIDYAKTVVKCYIVFGLVTYL